MKAIETDAFKQQQQQQMCMANLSQAYEWHVKLGFIANLFKKIISESRMMKKSSLVNLQNMVDDLERST